VNTYKTPELGKVIEVKGKVILLVSLASIVLNFILNFSQAATAVEKSAITFTVTSVFLGIFTLISLKSAFQVDIFFVETTVPLIINLTFVMLLVLTPVPVTVSGAKVILVTFTSDTSFALIENCTKVWLVEPTAKSSEAGLPSFLVITKVAEPIVVDIQLAEPTI
jgi:hypothetical protein